MEVGQKQWTLCFCMVTVPAAGVQRKHTFIFIINCKFICLSPTPFPQPHTMSAPHNEALSALIIKQVQYSQGLEHLCSLSLPWGRRSEWSKDVGAIVTLSLGLNLQHCSKRTMRRRRESAAIKRQESRTRCAARRKITRGVGGEDKMVSRLGRDERVRPR